MLNPVTEMKGSSLNGLVFEGEVVANNDPLHEERCRIRIPVLHEGIPDSVLPWARPDSSRTQGSSSTVQSFGVPTIGSKLYVILQGGDIQFPMYRGGIVNADTKCATADTNYPHRYGFKDAKGNILFVDTSTGDVDFHHFSGTFIKILPSGQLDVHTASHVTLDVVGNVTATVSGNVSATVGGNATANVTGNLGITAGGTASLTSTGNTTVNAPVIELKGGGGAAKGVVQADCMCAFTGAPHPQVSATVKGAM